MEYCLKATEATVLMEVYLIDTGEVYRAWVESILLQPEENYYQVGPKENFYEIVLKDDQNTLRTYRCAEDEVLDNIFTTVEAACSALQERTQNAVKRAYEQYVKTED